MATSVWGGIFTKGYILDSSDDEILRISNIDSSVNVVNKNSEIPEDFIFIRFNILNFENSFLEAYVSPRTTIYDYEYWVGGIWGKWTKQVKNLDHICERAGYVCLLDEYNGVNFLKESLTNICVEEYKKSISIKPRWIYKEEVVNSPRCQPLINEEKKKTQLALEKRKQELEKEKQATFNKLYSTCLSYGFEERSDIASCIQQEIFNEKKLAILEQQKLAQNQEQVEKQEETNIWLNILEGVTDNLSDPLFWENARLNAELKRRPLKRYPAPPIKENPNK